VNAWRKTLVGIAVVAFVVLALPAIAYGIGLSKIEGRPIAADPASFSSAQVNSAWQSCREHLPIALDPLNPWGYAAKILWGDTGFAGNGQLAAWLVARRYNSSHLPGGMKWWHLSGAALTIWVTRNWSAEQVAATLARDESCK
jgi:hypothetical protein